MLTFPCIKEVCDSSYFGQQVTYGCSIIQVSGTHLHSITQCVCMWGAVGVILTLIKNKRTTTMRVLAQLCEEVLLPFITLYMKFISEV